MFRADLIEDATRFLAACKTKSLLLATAESCTGGLISALLTEIPGASAVLERGCVTYSNDAKIEMLGVHAEIIQHHGAVSEETARAMAQGALIHSEADLAIAVTGIAGPDGGSLEKPVGLVHLAVARIGGSTLHRECRYGAIDRAAIRVNAVRDALALAREAIEYDEPAAME